VAINTTNIVGMTPLRMIAPIARQHLSPRFPKYLKEHSLHHRRSGPQTNNNKEPPQGKAGKRSHVMNAGAEQQTDYPLTVKRPGGGGVTNGNEQMINPQRLGLSQTIRILGYEALDASVCQRLGTGRKEKQFQHMYHYLSAHTVWRMENTQKYFNVKSTKTTMTQRCTWNSCRSLSLSQKS
jgi:hypothetical protein